MTLLSENPDLWDTVFSESSQRLRFISRIVARAGGRVLDVGCATGALCRELGRRGGNILGVDLNARFIRKARSKDGSGTYRVGNMRTFKIRRQFDLIICVGTTFSYNLSNRQIRTCLENFRNHLRPNGYLLIDVLNAAAFLGPLPFRSSTRHEFSYLGGRAVATIQHRLHLRKQTMSEQVSWAMQGRRLRRDPPEELRLLFPQELVFHLETAGFERIELTDRYGRASAAFDGRRLIAVARTSASARSSLNRRA